MKTIYHYITVVCLLFACFACDQEEVPTFHEERGINFVLYNVYYDEYTDDYENLESTYNFYEDYAKQGSLILAPCTLYVGLQLEGTFSDLPVKVRIKSEAVEGYEMPDITLPEEVEIAAGEYRTHFPVICRQPVEYEKEFKVKLSIDYEASDVVPGTKERQSYVLTITDETIWKDMHVENAEEWNTYYSAYLGTCGGKKIRFIFVDFASYGPDYNYAWVCNVYNYTKIGGYYEWYGFYNYGYYLYADLSTWNSTHDTPLCEPDGTSIEFPDIY